MLKSDLLSKINSLGHREIVLAFKYASVKLYGKDSVKDYMAGKLWQFREKIPATFTFVTDENASEIDAEISAILARATGYKLPDMSVSAEEEKSQDSKQSASNGADNAAIASAIGNAIAGVLGTIKTPCDETMVRDIVRSEISSQVSEIAIRAANEASKALLPLRVEISRNGVITQIEGLVHETFPALLKRVGAGVHVWLVGPAGSGKTTAGLQCANALGKKFYTQGACDTKYDLLGFRNAMGETVRTQFREAYEHGGVMLLDEVDAYGPGAGMALNSALANGHCDFPDGLIARHTEFVCIAAANTYGLGATSDYVGRCKHDGAFLDRFIQMAWDYDAKLEIQACGNRDWALEVQTFRAKARAKGIKVIISPRASIYGAKLLAKGIPKSEVIRDCIRKGMRTEDWASISS